MGCDIHTFIERKALVYRDTKDGSPARTEWLDGNLYVKNSFYDSTDPENTEPEYCISRHLQERDYQLFAVLGNVRNYNDLPCITADRGMPYDASQALLDAYSKDEADAHSLSYITLRELRDWYNAEKDNELKNQLLEKPQLYKLFEPWFDFIKNHVAYSYFIARYEESLWDHFRITFWFDN